MRPKGETDCQRKILCLSPSLFVCFKFFANWLIDYVFTFDNKETNIKKKERQDQIKDNGNKMNTKSVIYTNIPLKEN